jgi:hypothetical protein
MMKYGTHSDCAPVRHGTVISTLETRVPQVRMHDDELWRTIVLG